MKQLTIKFVLSIPPDADNEKLVHARFYHFEYQPFSGQNESIDLVTYGHFGKVFYFSNGDFAGDKIVEVVRNQQTSSVLITRDYEFKDITEENFQNYFDHDLKLTVTDSKVHVSNRAKHDKSKSLKIKSTGEAEKNIETILKSFWRDNQAKESNNQRILKALEILSSRAASKAAKHADKIANKPTKAEKFLATVSKMATSEEGETKKSKNSTLHFSLSKLFLNKSSYVEHGHCQGSILDLYTSIEVAGPFLSNELERKLNPMLIHIKSIGPLPETPIVLDQLKRTCGRPYVEFSIFNQVYKTPEVELTSTLRFNTSFVLLAGKISSSLLRKYLNFGRLGFRLFDRKEIDKSFEPALYGQDVFDDVWSRGDSLRQIEKSKGNVPSHGLASINVTELARGATKLIATVPVLPVDSSTGLLAGHYLQETALNNPIIAGTEMKVRIEVKYPLSLTKTGFGSIIVVSYDHLGSVDALKREIVRVNNQLSFNVSNTETVTGFHIETRNGPSILVLEADLKTLHKWHKSEHIGSLVTLPNAKVFFDSELIISDRRYGTLDVRFSRIILNFPISDALSNSKVYCKSTVSQLVTNALIKVDFYSKLASLKQFSVDNDFLSAEEVKSLINDLSSLFESYGIFENVSQLVSHSQPIFT